MTQQEMQASLEAIIYAADEPATIDQLSHALNADKVEVRAALDLLVAAYSVEDRGIEIRKVAGGWKFYTKPQHHEVVRRFIKALQPPIRLTMPALETLAVIAYKQPATIPEINEIRGVNVGGVIKTLLEKRLITTCGRKEVIGRPILYRTSKQFLMRFGLSDLDELPSLKEFEQLAQAALGSDAGIAPTEPNEEAQATREDANVDADVAPGLSPASADSGAVSDVSGVGSIEESAAASEAQTVPDGAADAVADASGAQATEADAIADASGEQAAEAESAESPAQSAAESFADSDENSRAASAGSKGTSDT